MASLSFLFYLHFITLWFQLFSIIFGIGYLIHFISFEWEKSQFAAFKRVFFVCIIGCNLASIGYQVTQFFYSLGLLFGIFLIPYTQEDGHLAFINLALTFHAILIYFRTKTVLKAMGKSIIILNFMALCHFGCFVADFAGFSPVLQVFISVLDVYCTWIFTSFVKQLRSTSFNKVANLRTQHSIIHQKASIYLCLCSAVGGFTTILDLFVVQGLLFDVNVLAAQVSYFLLLNSFQVSLSI
jgi:hypothetical protein